MIVVVSVLNTPSPLEGEGAGGEGVKLY